MRRMNGRSPPFVIVGLIFVCVILAYNYWTLSSQNDDLRKELDKLQAEIKIEGVKQDQFEKKNHLLQSSVHDLNEKSERLQQQIEHEDKQLTDYQNLNKQKTYEITKLKNELIKKEAAEKECMQQVEDKDGKIEELTSDTQRILSLKNDAEEALSEKDSLINDLKRQLDQAKSVATRYEAQLRLIKDEYSKLKSLVTSEHKEKLALPNPVPGIMNLQNVHKNKPYLSQGSLGYVPKGTIHTRDKGLKGFKLIEGMPILPRQPPNAERAKPRFSVADIADESSHKDIHGQNLDKLQKTTKEKHPEYVNHGIPHPPLHENDNNVDHVYNVVENPNEHREDANKPLLPPLDGLRRRPAPLDLHGELQEISNPVLHPPDNAAQDEMQGVQQEEANVIPQPPQNPDENLDAAIDEEGKAMEDPLDDQDEEGKEIKKDLQNKENLVYNDDYDNDIKDKMGDEKDTLHDPRGIGAMELPDEKIGKKHHHHKHHKNNIDEELTNKDKANDRVIEGNFESKLRNLGRHL